MKSGNPCSVCGNTDLNLVDGFYYCIECGTQDATARETIVEYKSLGDGTFAQTFKKKIRQVQNDKVEMTGEWYKWHAFNFVLAGLADDLIKLGAKPSFKIKLLWVWTRYIKKYQNKEELGLSKDVREENNSDNENHTEKPIQTSKYFKIKECLYRRINYITPIIVFTLIYIALNLDKSEIQLSHLLMFLKEKRLCIYDALKYIPKEIKFRDIPHWKLYITCQAGHVIFSAYRIRILAVTLFKDLDLGYPVIPDIRKLIDNYTTELCLPEDFKQLVFSLIYKYPCEFLNVDQKPKMTRVPDYEGVTIAYILVALKMCFGLDDECELKLSEVVERINDQENHLKCYKSGFMETDRLFSFREWLTYLQFRKTILLQNCLLTETEHFNDIEDYMYMEYVGKETSGSKMFLEDEITLNILNKIPLDELDVIPKNLFEPSLTPMTSYSKVIGEYHKESDVRLLLCEDFTKYSLKYACQDLNLTDQGINIMLGINKSNKPQSEGNIKLHFFEPSNLEMVFIKNCENKNWMKTKPPLIDHVTVSHEEDKDSDSDPGYDSHAENTSDKDMSIVCDNTINTTNKYKDDVKLETVAEDDNINIYDDDFIDIYYKEEVEAAENEDLDENAEEPHSDNKNDDPIFSDDEDYNFYDTIEFNPNTFNREGAIKELILAACKKYKIPIPQEYRSEVPKRKLVQNEAGVSNESKPKKQKICKPGEAKQEIGNLLEEYYNCAQKDIISNITEQVQEAIRNANVIGDDINESHVNQIPDDVFNDTGHQLNETQTNEHEIILDESVINNEQNNEADEIGIEIVENLENTLFDEDSNGEVNLDEIITKNDPKFDEKRFDVKQLYIKLQGETAENDQDNIHDIANEPEIKEMIKQKVEGTPDSDGMENLDVFDSEDDLPLTMFKEDILFQQEFKERKKEFSNRLITNENIPKYNYWLRHYKDLSRMRDAQLIFDNEAKKNLPNNFRFILNECASIINCSPFHVYKCMQYLEISIMSKYGLKS
ncbi:hypothetical protein K1T71_013478 [Dendrolimus kikuchii]|uniref:Uncharacterized protein n=1 Tax=Dendrolimus kikuchii TaxID=765133 RepID=A0ACC1CGS6_9NEOP|nr:hypothetical protein K1T71_013478 [Dendrolimus kikuchii]